MASTFKGFTCWDGDRVEDVTDPVALNIDSATFSAVHTPMEVGIRRGTSGQSFSSYSEDDLLDDLRDDSANHQFILVKGDAGSGKSHLIRWVSTQLPSTNSRHVVLVPRAQTNLRGMISSLLEGFEGDETFDPYRKALRNASSIPSAEAGRDQLLSQLAHSIQHNYVAGDRADQKYDEHAAENLPALLHEPYFRKHHWLKENGVIARLYDRALGASEKGVGEGEKQRFEEGDLPRDLGGGVSTGNQDVLKFYDLLETQKKVREAALRVLNRHLKLAVQRMLNFSGEDLLDLFLDIRETLYERGQELILLIEDVARQQGLSGAILEALIVRPSEIQPRSLCRVRSLVGITPDPFSLLPDNITQKTTSVISLGQNDPADSEEAVLPMAARYLNAARLSQEKLDEWHKKGDAGLPPSACDDCSFKSTCHDAFGEVEGMGLYPFNEEALKQMYQRKDDAGFNPRVLLRDVLNWPLKSGIESIEKGKFPSRQLHEEFGGTKGWSADELDRVRNMPDADRRVPLLDLWSTRRKAENLKDGIHEAFDIEKVDLAPSDTRSPETEPNLSPSTADGSVSAETAREDQVEGTDPTPDKDSTVSEDSATSPEPQRPQDALTEPEQAIWSAFDAWANGESLDMTIVNRVRKRLRSALYHYIDWDGERLLRSSLYGNRVFENESINFEEQAASLGNAEVVVELPTASQTRTSVASGLQALLLYDHYGDWQFERGENRLIKYASLLEETADSIVQQLRHPPGPADSWNPGITAAEVLRLGARAAGKPAPSQTTLPDRLDALFEYFPGDDDVPDSVSREWEKMMEGFSSAQDDLRELVKAYNICPKGGQSTNLLLDSAKILPILNRNNLRPRTDFPADSSDLPSRLRFLHRFVSTSANFIRAPIQRETERWVEWVKMSEINVGPPERLEHTIETVRTTVSALEEVGALRVSMRTTDGLRTACSSINASQYAHLWSCAQSIRNGRTDSSLWAQLREIGYVNRPRFSETHDAVRSFISLAEKILSSSEEWMEDRLEERDRGEEQLREAFTTFLETLRSLASELTSDPAEAEYTSSGFEDPASPSNSQNSSPSVTDDNVLLLASGKDADQQAGDDDMPDADMPDLVRRGQNLQRLAERYRVSRRQGEYTQELVDLQEEFGHFVEEVVRLKRAGNALRSCGVDIDPFIVNDSLVEDAQRQLNLLEEDIDEYLRPGHNELRKKFGLKLDNAIESYETKVMEAWRSHAQDNLIPPYNADIISIFDGVPTCQTHVDALREQIKRLEAFTEELPLPETINGATRASEEIQERLQKLFGNVDENDRMLPESVKTFLQKAASGGAPLNSLDDEVLSWLRSRDYINAFVITVDPDFS